MRLRDTCRLALDENMAPEHVEVGDDDFLLSFGTALVSISEASDMGLLEI
jgi:hypothetical protein